MFCPILLMHLFSEQAQQKLIPVIIKNCELDGMIKMISKINLCENASALSEWSWNNLISSIKSTGNSSFVEWPRCALRAPTATKLRPQVSGMSCLQKPVCSEIPTQVETPQKGKSKWLSNIFNRKKNNSCSSASSGFQSMASPE